MIERGDDGELGTLNEQRSARILDFLTALPHLPFEPRLGATAPKPPVQIHVHKSLSEVPAVAPQAASAHERLPGHPVARRPVEFSQNLADFIQRFEWYMNIYVHTSDVTTSC